MGRGRSPMSPFSWLKRKGFLSLSVRKHRCDSVPSPCLLRVKVSGAPQLPTSPSVVCWGWPGAGVLAPACAMGLPVGSEPRRARAEESSPPAARRSGGAAEVTESQNHRIVGVGRDLCGSSSPTPLPKQGHLQ